MRFSVGAWPRPVDVLRLRGRDGGLGQHVAEEPPREAALDLRYVLDQPIDLKLYRVTLLVGNQSLTRAYVEQDNALLPAGSWVRRE